MNPAAATLPVRKHPPAVSHGISLTLAWADPTGTDSFSNFSRDHVVSVTGKDEPLSMSVPQWNRGDPTRYDPGELFLAALASSHMARFLEIASQVGLVVVAYDDDVAACARLGSRGDGQFADVVLRPSVVVRAGPHANVAEVARIHKRAQSMSIVCKSVSVAVTVLPGQLTVLAADLAA
jgi:organic hydroperoxide reductase OsmC/OhrA